MVLERKEGNKVTATKAPHCSTPCKHSRPPGPCAPSPSTFRPPGPCAPSQSTFRPPGPLCAHPETLRPSSPVFQPGAHFGLPGPCAPTRGTLAPAPCFVCFMVVLNLYARRENQAHLWRNSHHQKTPLNECFMGLYFHLYVWALARAITRHFLSSKCVTLRSSLIIQWDRFTHFPAKRTNNALRTFGFLAPVLLALSCITRSLSTEGMLTFLHFWFPYLTLSDHAVPGTRHMLPANTCFASRKHI